MAAAFFLRDEFDGSALRGLGKMTKDTAQARPLLALGEIYDGGARSGAARIGGVGLLTIRDWVLRFNARGPAELIDGKAPGNAPKLDDAQRRALTDIVARTDPGDPRGGALALG
jgi:transposase